MTRVSAPDSLWRNTRYLTWLVSDTSKGLAAALFGFAIPLLALIVTNDPAQAGLIGGAGMVVRLVTTLVGGVLADRHPRILLMLIGALIGVVLSAAFVVLALADALAFGTLIMLDVLLAARTGFFDVAGESAIKEIVPADAMGRAQAANQGRDAALQLAGGPLGGLLLGVGGWLVGVVMAACHLLAAASAWLLGRLAAAHTESDAAADPDQGRADAETRALGGIREGFSWLFSRPDLRGVLIVTTIINLGFNAAITTIVYALQQAGYSPVFIGTLSSALGVMMLLGAIVAPFLIPRIGAGVLAILSLACSTAGAAAVSVITDPWSIAAALALSVFLLPSLNAALLGYFMVATPTRLLGRANSAVGVLSMAALPLAPLIAGLGLAWIGRLPTLLVCAALCLIAVLLALGSRSLRALPVESRWSEHAARFD